jgi:polyisoprenoid-binding protein YceI
MRERGRVALLSVLAVAAFAAAAQGPPSTPMPLVFDPARSHASFKVRMRIARPAIGHFLDVRGELQADGERQRVAVEVDGRRLRFEGPAWMERVTRSEDFLDVDRHPRIHFRSEPFAPDLLRAGGALRGELTLRGRTLPVTFRVLPAACATPGRGCDIEVAGKVSRHAFGMDAYRIAVRDNVEFDFSVRLAPEPAP